jgi:hypothetical protein
MFSIYPASEYPLLSAIHGNDPAGCMCELRTRFEGQSCKHLDVGFCAAQCPEPARGHLADGSAPRPISESSVTPLFGSA